MKTQHAHKPLSAEELANDPRIAQAKELIRSAVSDHSHKITGIRAPNSELKQEYDDLINRMNEHRGGKLWYPYIGSGIGNGALVELLDGSVKYDFICGIGTHYFGHSHPEIIQTCIEAALSDTVMQGNLQQNVDTLEFMETLLKASHLEHCFLCTSGAMANENALKIAFQHKFPASRILAFEHCFAGRTLAVSQITDKPHYREGLPANVLVDYIPYFDAQNPEKSTAAAVEALKKLLLRYPKEYAVMMCELVQGEGGFHPGSTEFFKAIMGLLKDNNVLVLADEVQTFGRTSELFAFQHFGLHDYIDMVSIGKLTQVCATLFRKDLKPRPGLLSQTFTGSTSAIRAGTTIVRLLLEGGYFGPQGKIQKTHEYFAGKLQGFQKQYPHIIKGPYGIGAMIAFTPFNGEADKAIKFVHALFEAGVIAFTAGAHPTRVRFLLPSLAVTFKDIDAVFNIVSDLLLKMDKPA